MRKSLWIPCKVIWWAAENSKHFQSARHISPCQRCRWHKSTLHYKLILIQLLDHHETGHSEVFNRYGFATFTYAVHFISWEKSLHLKRVSFLFYLNVLHIAATIFRFLFHSQALTLSLSLSQNIKSIYWSPLLKYKFNL